jgi:hypothetical protein
MKSWYLLAWLALATPSGAQNAPAPTAPTGAPSVTSTVTLQTAPATILTPDFIRSCTYIAHGLLNFKTDGEQTLGEMAYGRYVPLKGGSNFMPSRLGLGEIANWKDGENVLLFSRYDSTQKRLVAIGKLPATPENIAKVKQLVAQTPDFEVTFSTDKKEYALGEPVKVTWTLKNIAPEAKSLYTGEFATQVNLIYDNKSTSSTDVNARKRPAFTEVKPGQSWIHERTLDGPFPVGTLGLQWTYYSRDALQRGGATPINISFLHKTGDTAVEIRPASATQIQELSAGIKSPRWNEQLDAAQTMLQSADPAQWKKLEGFATHPYGKLREIAAQALAKGGTFTPALKTLLYGGTTIPYRSVRQTPGEFALALLASAAVEAEARERGFKGPPPTTPVAPSYYSGMAFNDDARIGDILADRLQRDKPLEGGVNNGAVLLSLAGLKDPIGDSTRPLSDELQARVLAAWNAKRATVKDPFTQPQLDAEIALARKIRYDDFQVGPFYETVAALIDEGRKRDFLGSPEQDVWNKKIVALPGEAAPDLLRVLKWREIASPPKSVLRFLANSGLPEVFPYLAQIAYGQGYPNGDARLEAIRLMAQLDYERATTHIENFLALPFQWGDWSREAPRMGAALALAAHGDKRGVPIIFSPEYEKRLVYLDRETAGQALKAATGQEFPNLFQWQRWWKAEGQKMEWK